jgi:hypothetical protein
LDPGLSFPKLLSCFEFFSFKLESKTKSNVLPIWHSV